MFSGSKAQTDEFLERCLPGNHEKLRKVKDQIFRLNTQLTEGKSVLLLGETGAGKTYIAKIIAMHRCWIHNLFIDKSKGEAYTDKEIGDIRSFYVKTRGATILKDSAEPFHELSLPAFEGDMARSQLFGHKKGAFTGAHKAHIGFMSLKNVTDILLDEIGYASERMQRDLLQFLQSGSFYPLGSTTIGTFKGRLMFATNQDLKALVTEGKFQADLFWRLVDHVIVVPPLRVRKEEIRILCEEILADLRENILGDKTGESGLYLSESDLRWAEAYPWPGNYRELDKTLRRWMFYRGEKTLNQACDEVGQFIPSKAFGHGITIDESVIEEYFNGRLRRAMDGDTEMITPSEEIEVLLQSTREKIESILLTRISKAGKLSNEHLEKLFKKAGAASVRNWLSKVRKKSSKLSQGSI